MEIRDKIAARTGWDNRTCTIAARFIIGAETEEDLRFRTQGKKPELTLPRAYDILALKDT